MTRALILRNRQHARPVDLRLLRRVTRAILAQMPGVRGFELGVHLVDTAGISQLNETYLAHQGPTDVITFSYDMSPVLHGDIFISVNEAVRQAPRFGGTWQVELVRYLVHGILHLCGHDDRDPVRRRRMKRAENKCVAALEAQFPLERLRRPQ